MPAGTDFGSCAVCGRTILRGERVAEYATPDGERVGVCALCKAAAEDAGWVPASLAGTLGKPGERRRRGLGLRHRLSRASEAAKGLRSRPDGEGAAGGEDASGARAGGSPKRAAREAREQRSRRVERRAGNGRERQPEQERSERPRGREAIRFAVEVFNASREPRKVAGLIRSLGEPQVALRLRSGGAVRVTVAWELSWYQWEVNPSEGRDSVRQTAKGSEVSELAERDRAWNASAGSDGMVRLKRAAATAAPAEPG